MYLNILNFPEKAQSETDCLILCLHNLIIKSVHKPQKENSTDLNYNRVTPFTPSPQIHNIIVRLISNTHQNKLAHLIVNKILQVCLFQLTLVSGVLVEDLHDG